MINPIRYVLDEWNRLKLSNYGVSKLAGNVKWRRCQLQEGRCLIRRAGKKGGGPTAKYNNAKQ